MNLNFMWSLHLTMSGVHWVMLGTVVDFLLGGDAYWVNIITSQFFCLELEDGSFMLNVGIMEERNNKTLNGHTVKKVKSLIVRYFFEWSCTLHNSCNSLGEKLYISEKAYHLIFFYFFLLRK